MTFQLLEALHYQVAAGGDIFMSTTEPPRVAKSSLARDLLHAARYYLGGRRGLIVAAALVLVAGLALNWSWLVAAGIAPLLVAVLLCAAMCALGLCMNKAGGKSLLDRRRKSWREPGR